MRRLLQPKPLGENNNTMGMPHEIGIDIDNDKYTLRMYSKPGYIKHEETFSTHEQARRAATTINKKGLKNYLDKHVAHQWKQILQQH